MKQGSLVQLPIFMFTISYNDPVEWNEHIFDDQKDLNIDLFNLIFNYVISYK